jgi:hypothetical protein
MAELKLRSARISFFLPPGYPKAESTKVSVRVSTKLKLEPQKELPLAEKTNFAGASVWEDDGQHTYTYALNISPAELAQTTGDLRTIIEITPQSYDNIQFDYKLTLIFDDGDPSSATIQMTQSRNGVRLDQEHRSFHSWRIFTPSEHSRHASYSVCEVDW